MTFVRTQYRLRIPWDAPAPLDLAAIGTGPPSRRPLSGCCQLGLLKGSRKTNIQENLGLDHMNIGRFAGSRNGT